MKKFIKNLLKFVRDLFGRKRFVHITLPIILVIALVLIGLFTFDHPAKKTKNLKADEAKKVAEEFVNDNLMQAGTKATIKEITEEYDLYKLKIDIVSTVVESYLTKDGKLFFPQALDVEEIKAAATGNSNNAAAPIEEVTNKTAKPKVELFVMSYCPYGTQIEKGILPALDALKNKVDFELKFCDYAMHGEKELTENLSQYCLQKEQPEKLSAYLTCFLESSDSAACLKTTGVNEKKLSSCVSKTDKEYKVIENFNNKEGYNGSYPGFDVNKEDNQKYDVPGSPTLVINGQTISSNRDSASLLKTICSAFTEAPEECLTELSSATPTPGFGSGTTNAGSAASCN